MKMVGIFILIEFGIVEIMIYLWSIKQSKLNLS